MQKHGGINAQYTSFNAAVKLNPDNLSGVTITTTVDKHVGRKILAELEQEGKCMRRHTLALKEYSCDGEHV